MGNNLSHDLSTMDMLSLEQSITIQLRSNHYPPVPYSMVPICIEAINAYNDGDYSKRIDLPEGVSWRGEESAPANAIIEQHHLENWIEYGEDY